MTSIDEIANNIFRISTYFADFNLQFNQFLIRDDEPLLFETGMKGMFPLVREAVSKIIDPASLRYVAFSHFEPDECGSLNDWLALAPRAEALTSVVGAMVFVNDGAFVLLAGSTTMKSYRPEATGSASKRRRTFLMDGMRDFSLKRQQRHYSVRISWVTPVTCPLSRIPMSSVAFVTRQTGFKAVPWRTTCPTRRARNRRSGNWPH